MVETRKAPPRQGEKFGKDIDGSAENRNAALNRARFVNVVNDLALGDV